MPHIEVNVRVDGDALLDMLMYYNRLYLATNGGLYSVEPFNAADPPVGFLDADRKVSDACYSASAGLGTIAASCGPKGLHLFFDDLRWASASKPTRKASRSQTGAEIGYGSVANHRSRSDYEFLAITVEEARNRSILIDTQKAAIGRSHAIDDLLSATNQGIEFTFWDQRRLVMFGGGDALSVSVMASGDQRQLNRVREFGAYGDVIGRVISAARVGRHFAMESDDSVAFISDGDARRVETGPIVSLRTYPYSHRHRRLTTATNQKGLWMLGWGE